jgi:hypothetical protein
MYAINRRREQNVCTRDDKGFYLLLYQIVVCALLRDVNSVGVNPPGNWCSSRKYFGVMQEVTNEIKQPEKKLGR